MPTVNLYGHNKLLNQQTLSSFKVYIADLLSGQNITLDPNEVSIRLIETVDTYMIAELECEIKAHAFPERVQKQDEICNEVRSFLLENLPEIKDVRVWLILSELGHSF